MAKDNSTSFVIPAEMRAMAEKNVEQARQAFASFLGAAEQAAMTASTQVTGAQAGAREMGELALRFAERNVASSFEFAQKLVRARDPQEVMALHAEYAQSQIGALTDQAQELNRQAARMARQSGQH
jgi:phasin